MILLKTQIEKEINKKIIYQSKNQKIKIGPNSIDVTINKVIKTYVECEIIEKEIEGKKYKIIQKKDEKDFFFLRMDKKQKVYEYEIPSEGLILTPGILYLGSTNESVGSEDYVPMYEGRSSTARLGFQSHISAGFGDIGFTSNWTLEITVIHPLLVFPDIRVGQVFFYDVEEEELLKMKEKGYLYNSKYNIQPKAQESKMYLDFENPEEMDSYCEE